MQNGIRHLRALKIVYRPDVRPWEYHAGGMKTFVEDGWLERFQQRNPDVKVEIQTVEDAIARQGDHHFPRVVGYYLNGSAQTVFASRLSAEAIEQNIYELRNTVNERAPLPGQNAVIETHTKSVQGMWTPYLWMKDSVIVDEGETAEDDWREDIKQIAKFVRLKKEHREREFTRRHYIDMRTKKRMEERWEEQVFPYTVGTETRAVPGRLFLEETKTLFPEAGETPPASATEKGGGGYMGGFVSPYSKAEASVLGSDMQQGTTYIATNDKYSVNKFQRGGTVPPFAGAPFTSGYGDYENFWKNWDLFNYSSQRYRPPAAQVPPVGLRKERRQHELSSRIRMQKGREDNWAKES
eukprot:TRINITY_DN19814_c0_g1_i1.p2 TRINITY_DN19814_c0_g1~~TRINITY_DN19814_c0_g1_i1.p2  ORF type:complete len:353 (+),score=94.60 TRINITY_DN19814_c0_g1_i1:270-1328(+)